MGAAALPDGRNSCRFPYAEVALAGARAGPALLCGPVHTGRPRSRAVGISAVPNRTFPKRNRCSPDCTSNPRLRSPDLNRSFRELASLNGRSRCGSERSITASGPSATKSVRPGIVTLLTSFEVTGRRLVRNSSVHPPPPACVLVNGVLKCDGGLSFNLTYVRSRSGAAVQSCYCPSALVCIVARMGLPTLGVYVLLAALVATLRWWRWASNRSQRICNVLYFGMMSP